MEVPPLNELARAARARCTGCWSGGFKFDVVAPNGVAVFSGSGTHSATRIRVEPL
jgi:hypothetical protein